MNPLKKTLLKPFSNRFPRGIHLRHWLMLAVITGFLLQAFSVKATVIIVESRDDSGIGTLRNAIATASSGDTIKLSTQLISKTITLESGELLIDKNLTIIGFGSTLNEIEGSGTGRVFQIGSGATLTLKGFRISNGYLNGGDVYGAGILNNGTLYLYDCEIYGNRLDVVTFGFGAGIANLGNLYMYYSKINYNYMYTDNGAMAEGVGLYNEGYMELYYCAIHDNTLSGMGIVWGGGIGNSGSSADMKIFNSSIYYNIADYGGGIHASSGSLGTIDNTTISNNTGDISGAGIDTYAMLNLYHVTIATNTGIGLHLYSSSDLQISNSVLYGNSLGNVVEDAASSVSSTYVVSNDFSYSFVGTGDNIDTGLSLGTLKNLGKSGMGHIPLYSSSVSDAVETTNASSIDQRGWKRPAGTKSDIGAIELGALPIQPTSNPSNQLFHDVSAQSLKLVFQHANDLPDGYLILRRLSSTAPTAPTDNNTYSTGTVFNGQTVVAIGIENFIEDNQVKPNQSYSYDIYAFNGNASTGMDFQQVSPLSGTVETPVIPFIYSISPISSATGQEVRITGKGFAPNLTDNRVFFGTTEATIASITGTTDLQVIVPKSLASITSVSVLNTTNDLVADYDKSEIALFDITFTEGSVTDSSYNYFDYFTGNPMRLMATGDLNGDRLVDVALVDDLNKTIQLYYRKADNTGFEWVKTESLTNPNASDLVIEDIDGDGRADIAICYETAPAYLSVHFNNGDNSFESVHLTLTGNSATDLEVADLRHDGVKDISVLTADPNFGTSKVEIVYQDLSRRSFDIPSYSIETMNFVNGIALGEFNNDSLTDVAVIIDDFTDNIQIYNYNAGMDTYDLFLGAPAFVTSKYGGAYPTDALVNDIDNDGENDLLLYSESNNEFSVMLGAATNEQITDASTYTIPTGSSSIELADLDGDGNMDVVIGHYLNTAFTFFKGYGDGSFATQQSISLNHPSDKILAGHFNADGKADLISLSYIDTTFTILSYMGPYLEMISAIPGLNDHSVPYENDIVLEFSEEIDAGTVFNGISYFVHGSISGFFSEATASVNGKQLTIKAKPSVQDFVAGETITVSINQQLKSINGRNLGQNTSYQFETAGNASQPYFHVSSSMDLGMQTGALASADINGGGTGNYDIAVTLPSNGEIAIYQNLNPNNFESWKTLTTGPNPRDILLADLDLNGVIDVVSASTTDGLFEIIWNPTSATPAHDMLMSDTGSKPISIAKNDFNADGYIDIVMADSSNNNLYLFTNESGSFSEPSVINTAPTPVKVLSRDINQDGLADLMTGHANGAGIQIHIKGTSSFTTSTLSTTSGSSVKDLAMAYLNADNYPDIIWIAEGSNNIYVSLYDADNGIYATTNAVGVTNFPNSLATGDFDGDGKMDIAVANTGSKDITVFLNDGSSTFTNIASLPLSGEPVDLIASDFNKDGRIDLAASIGSAQQVQIILNEVQPAVTVSDLAITGINLKEGSTNNLIYQLKMNGTVTTATLQSLQLKTAGTYLVSDVALNGLKLWYNNTDDFSTATLINSLSSTDGNGESLLFDNLSLSIPVNTDAHFWLTVDISATPTYENTIQVLGPTLADIDLGIATVSLSPDPLNPGGIFNFTPVLKPEPSSHVTGLSITYASHSEVQLEWTDASGIALPEKYVIIARKEPTAFPAITDGVELSDELDWSDGIASVAVTHLGAIQTTSFYNLDAGSYEFIILPYTNFGIYTNYKLDGTVPSVSASLTSEPTVQSSLLTETSKTAFEITAQWASGDGARRVVVVSESAAVDALPSDFSQYTANTVFGAGQNLGTNGSVVYNGTGNSVAVTGLSPEKTYYFQVFEYNGTGTLTNYLTGTGTDNPISFQTPAPEPSSHVTAFNLTYISHSEIQLDWIDATGTYLPDGYLLTGRLLPKNLPTITDGAVFANDSFWSDSLVTWNLQHLGAPQTLALDSLRAGDYEFTLIPFSNTNIDYKLDGAIPSVTATLTSEPTVQSNMLTVTSKSDTSISLQWEAGDGNRRILIASETNSLDAPPLDFYQYTADSLFGLGDLIGNNGYVVYNGTGTSIKVFGLSPQQSYYFHALEYNGSGAFTNYLLDTATDNPIVVQTLVTEPIELPDSVDFITVSHEKVEAEILATSSPTGYLILRSDGSSALPEDGTIYSKGNLIGGKTVVDFTNNPFFIDSVLTASTLYHYEIYPFNGGGESVNYLTPALKDSVYTIAAPPTARLENLVFPVVTSSSVEGRFSIREGSADGFMVLYTTLENSTDTLQNGVIYEVGDTIGGIYVSYVGVDTSFIQTNLINNTAYQFGVVPFNGNAHFRNYYTDSTLSAWVTTRNNPPSSIALDNSSVEEDSPIGTVIGNLSALDIDPNETHSFTLTEGFGDAHNHYFSIARQNQLVVDSILSTDITPTCTIRLKVWDSWGDSLEQRLSITVAPLITDEMDSLNLIAVYDSAGGKIQWPISEPVKTWKGVKVRTGRVRRLFLANKDLEHLHTQAIKGLDKLKYLNVSYNRLGFDYLEPLIGSADTVIYGMQGRFEQKDSIFAYAGEDIELSVIQKTPNEVYQWYKFASPLEQDTNAVLNLTQVQESDFGIYTCKVSSTVATDASLWREPYLVKIINKLSEADSLALLEVYTALGARFDPARPAGSWPGVMLDGNKIIEINLSSRLLDGYISPAIRVLDDLERLDLFNNTLSGNIPSEIGSLHNLTYLDLDQNELEGALPAEISLLKELNTLWLSRNKLTSIPDDLGGLEKLQHLFLQENLLDSIPSRIFNIDSLKILDLSSNNLSTIDGEWGLLLKLEKLILSGNKLEAIDVSILNATALRVLDLSDNQLTSLPGDFKNLPQLELLKVENNLLTFEDIEPLDIHGEFYTANYIPQQYDFEVYDALIAVGGFWEVHADIGGSANQYQWQKDETSLTDATLESFTLSSATLSDAGIYHAIVTNTAVPGLTIKSKAIRLSLTCGSEKSASISTAYSTEVCEGENMYVELRASSMEDRIYRWRKDGRNIALATDSIYVAFQPGTYSVLVTDPDGCSAFSNDIDIHLNPSPSVELSTTDSMTLAATSNSADVTYTWYRNGEELKEEGSTLHVSESGMYQVACTNASGCTSFSKQKQMVITALEDEVFGGKISLYPNPTQADLTIVFPQILVKDVQINLLDLTGKIVHSTVLKNVQETTLDIEHLPTGVFVVEILSEKGRAIKRVTKF